MDQIPVIGTDANGNPAQVEVPGPVYSSRLNTVLTSIQDSVIPVLNERDAAASERTTAQPWLLRTMAFGVGVNAEIGVGPITIGALPRTRLVFTNSTDPSLP